MAFRIETKAGAGLMLLLYPALLPGCQPWRTHSCVPRRHSWRRTATVRASIETSLDAARTSARATSPPQESYDVRHRHLRDSGPGVLRIDDTSISFEETGKKATHSRHWKY